ncbi:MAG: hypothetical protein V1734_05060 [Nanoarchaeota archaeon]
MSDGNLEKKTRGLKWYNALGAAVLAAAATGFFAGATGYRLGHDGGHRAGMQEGYQAGVAEGRESGYEAGKMEGFAEGLAAGIAQANESKPWAYGWVNEGSMFASLQRNVEGPGLVTYSIALNAPMIGTGEAVRMYGLDGISVSYADTLPHDGLVDLITMIDAEGNPTSFFLRAESYDAHQQLFDTADQSLKEIKAIFENKQ